MENSQRSYIRILAMVTIIRGCNSRLCNKLIGLICKYGADDGHAIFATIDELATSIVTDNPLRGGVLPQIEFKDDKENLCQSLLNQVLKVFQISKVVISRKYTTLKLSTRIPASMLTEFEKLTRNHYPLMQMLWWTFGKWIC